MKLFRILQNIPKLLFLYIAIKYLLPKHGKVKLVPKRSISNFFKKLKISPKKQVV